MTDTVFSKLSEDIVLGIFFKLDDDPRVWARLACVCTKFSSLIRTVCWRHKCSTAIPSVVSDLLSSSVASSSCPPGGWAALHKIAVCCPGLFHAGVLLENSYFVLKGELGRNENRSTYPIARSNIPTSSTDPCPSHHIDKANPTAACSWSLFDDLCYDTVYNVSDSQDVSHAVGGEVVTVEGEFTVSKRRKIYRSMRSHLASGVWNLSREQGSKLLARQFRDDSLYVCGWPGCVHFEEKRNYMLFRGIFKNFKRSRVWRTISDGNRSKVGVNCAFCPCKETWDLHSAFCLRRTFGYNDDGNIVTVDCKNVDTKKDVKKSHASKKRRTRGAFNVKGWFLCCWQ